MNRRAFVTGLGAVLAAPLGGEAQQVGNLVTIGWLSDGMRPDSSSHLSDFLAGMREFGYVEGRNIVVERRDAAGKLERLTPLAAELVRLNVAVIVASGGVPAAMAAKRATRSIPIVMTEGADPVRTGLVASLTRPGGNVTGVTAMAPDIVKKRLQLLKEAAPKISRVAVLIHLSFPGTLEGMKEARAGAPTLGLTVVPLEMGGPNELEDAFATVTRLGANALLGFGDPFIEAHRKQVIALAAKSGLPAIYSRRDFVEDGGLMAYGPNYDEMVRRAASYVDKILKGAKPADLPIEQPQKFELAINLKTAKALGLTIPPSLLLRADQVIE